MIKSAVTLPGMRPVQAHELMPSSEVLAGWRCGKLLEVYKLVEIDPLDFLPLPKGGWEIVYSARERKRQTWAAGILAGPAAPT